MKEFFISKSILSAKERTKWFQDLNTQLQTLFKLRDTGAEVDDLIVVLKKKIQQCNEHKGKEVVFNAKVDTLEKDETCSKFFFKEI